jgi:outer membrane biosynthesis protein TonB
MNSPFRNALIISTVIHFLVITPLYGFSMFKEIVDTKKPMVVDYVVLKEPKPVEIVKRSARQKVRETKKMELVKDVAAKPAAKKVEAIKTAVKISPAKSRIAQKTEAKIRATKDYISYYQLIREKIRQRLKDSYRSYYREGDVRLIFTLRSDGSLVSLNVDESGSTNNETLLDVAIRSVREAAPFQPFPKALSVPKMSFDLTVTFKK